MIRAKVISREYEVHLDDGEKLIAFIKPTMYRKTISRLAEQYYNQIYAPHLGDPVVAFAEHLVSVSLGAQLTFAEPQSVEGRVY